MSIIDSYTPGSKDVLVEAYTGAIYDATKIQKWALGKPSIFDSKIVVQLDFTESTGYLRIVLEDGMMIKKREPLTLIYKPYAEANEHYNVSY